MTDEELAREEAERRWPTIRPDDPLPIDYVISGKRQGFIAGAKWQAKQPVEVTDSMVERGRHAVGKAFRQGLIETNDSGETVVQSRGIAQAVLEAALGADV